MCAHYVTCSWGFFPLLKDEHFSDGSDRVCMLYFTREVYIGMYTTASPPCSKPMLFALTTLQNNVSQF